MDRRGAGAEVSYTLHNIGNVTLRPRAGLTASGALGRRLLTRGLTGLPAELLPGQEVRLSTRWDGPPAVEWAEVTVHARADGTTAQGRVGYAAHPSLTAVLALTAVIWSALGAASGEWPV
ncbi:hypothetical protein WKI68_30215 [Streptomyces sp. MS1.HAVA.3]|uniref:Uncharacterized protein n=1 Tax=Streptomyces caledonius TaxID=3134107 RepID=A0ABU8U970_9ACTN